MGLNTAQKKERSEYLEANLDITECSQRKPYAFISYASDNWETVFKSAVVPLQKQRGLRVYADKAFDKVNDKWIVPMLRNVRGADLMIAFISQSYIESYACFLELLTAVNSKKQIVFVSLGEQLHLGDTTDQPIIERGVKNEILNQGSNLATNTNNTSNDIMRAMKSAYTSLSTLLEQDALSKYDISDAFINFFRDASINQKTIHDLGAVAGTIDSISSSVFKTLFIRQSVSSAATPPQSAPAVSQPASGSAPVEQPLPEQAFVARQETVQLPYKVNSIKRHETSQKGKKIIAAVAGIFLLAVIGIMIAAISPKTVKDVVYRAGTATGTYSGSWKNGMPNGQGTITWDDGSIYTGEWKDGLENGQGIYTYVNGDSYTGELVNGLAEGNGTYKGSDGSVYVGEWKVGLINGQGTNNYANGDSYTGEWKDNYPNGVGTMTYSDGSVLSGTWQNGTFVN